MKKWNEVCKKAMEKWGYDQQQLMLMEECGELISALNKYNRQRIQPFGVITELADVSIMVEQMAIYLGWNEFLKERDRKLSRLKERLQ